MGFDVNKYRQNVKKVIADAKKKGYSPYGVAIHYVKKLSTEERKIRKEFKSKLLRHKVSQKDQDNLKETSLKLKEWLKVAMITGNQLLQNELKEYEKLRKEIIKIVKHGAKGPEAMRLKSIALIAKKKQLLLKKEYYRLTYYRTLYERLKDQEISAGLLETDIGSMAKGIEEEQFIYEEAEDRMAELDEITSETIDTSDVKNIISGEIGGFNASQLNFNINDFLTENEYLDEYDELLES